MSAESGAWLKRQREARGWSRNELARRMTDAAGSAVTAPVRVLEGYLSRWEAGNVAISARYRQLLDAVLRPGENVPVPPPFSGPASDASKWAVRGASLPAAPGPVDPGGGRPVRAGGSGTGNGLPEFLLVKECAAQARVSLPTIYRLVRQGHVESIKVGREIRIYTDSWLAYLQVPRPDLRPPQEPEGSGQRDHPPQTDGPPAGPAPEPARRAGMGAPLVVFRAPG